MKRHLAFAVAIALTLMGIGDGTLACALYEARRYDSDILLTGHPNWNTIPVAHSKATVVSPPRTPSSAQSHRGQQTRMRAG
jgi:hypothetical protein